MSGKVVLEQAEHDRLFGALLAAQAECAELHARVALLEDQNERIQRAFDAYVDRNGFWEARGKRAEVEVERLREALTAARDTFKRFGYPVYADCCDEALND